MQYTVSIDSNNNQKAPIDSYQEFLNHSSIDKDKVYAWRGSASIFPNINEASNAWVNLKNRILNNQTVYIRGYGRNTQNTQLYIDLYKALSLKGD